MAPDPTAPRLRGDGSAGDADYTTIGVGYSGYRRPDPRIAARVQAALGNAPTVLNVGAGSGSYEPVDRTVVAVEPSATMRAQRPAHLARAIDASAERLPLADNSVAAAMTTFSVHQWADPTAGLTEMRRVATGPVIVLTCDPALVQQFWLDDYAPEVLSTEARRYPALAAIAESLGGTTTVEPVPIPLDCSDGFNEAYYGRPEMLLDPAARRSCSAWSFVEPAVTDGCVEALRAALADGSWDAAHGHLRTRPEYAGSLVLIVNTPFLRDRLRALPVLTAAPLPSLEVAALPARPEGLFVDWLSAAIDAGSTEPHAMTLSTAGPDGHPNARVLLLKDVDDRGWWFATDTLSAKADELGNDPHVALTFYWPMLGRQVRVRGAARRADDAASAADFAARDPQARAVVLAARDLAGAGQPYTRADLATAVDTRLHAHPTGTDYHDDTDDTQPPWAAYAVDATQVEFWQADAGRLHHRVSYTRRADGGWGITQLPH